MAQGRSTKIISMIKWIRTSRLSIKNSCSRRRQGRPRATGCTSPSLIGFVDLLNRIGTPIPFPLNLSFVFGEHPSEPELSWDIA